VFKGAVYFGLMLNLVLTIFLFKYIGSPEKKFIQFLDRYPLWIALYVLILLFCLAAPLHHDRWVYWISLILLVNFSADTFAWFFGKNFGRHKLMPLISLKKTVEGALGGLISSVILGSVF